LGFPTGWSFTTHKENFWCNHPRASNSQHTTSNGTLSRKKKKKHKTVTESSESGKDHNSVSISDAKTESGNASDK
jgi:hypothetical protein